MAEGCGGVRLGTEQSCHDAAVAVQVFPPLFFLLRPHIACESAPALQLTFCSTARSHIARRLLAHVTRQKQGFARTRLRSSAQAHSSGGSSRKDIEKTKVLNAYGGRKSVLFAMMHSPDNRPATGTPAAASRNNRNERLAQLVAFSGVCRLSLACAASRPPSN